MGAVPCLDSGTLTQDLYRHAKERIPGGTHLKFGVMPDMAVFAKALGNGQLTT